MLESYWQTDIWYANTCHGTAEGGRRRRRGGGGRVPRPMMNVMRDREGGRQ